MDRRYSLPCQLYSGLPLKLTLPALQWTATTLTPGRFNNIVLCTALKWTATTAYLASFTVDCHYIFRLLLYLGIQLTLPALQWTAAIFPGAPVSRHPAYLASFSVVTTIFSECSCNQTSSLPCQLYNGLSLYFLGTPVTRHPAYLASFTVDRRYIFRVLL